MADRSMIDSTLKECELDALVCTAPMEGMTNIRVSWTFEIQLSDELRDRQTDNEFRQDLLARLIDQHHRALGQLFASAERARAAYNKRT